MHDIEVSISLNPLHVNQWLLNQHVLLQAQANKNINKNMNIIIISQISHHKHVVPHTTIS